MMIFVTSLVLAFNPLVLLFFGTESFAQIKKEGFSYSELISTYFGMVIFVFLVFGIHYLVFKFLGKNMSFNIYFKLQPEIYNFVPYAMGLISALVFFIDLTYSPASSYFAVLRSLAVLCFFFGIYTSLVLYVLWIYNITK